MIFKFNIIFVILIQDMVEWVVMEGMVDMEGAMA